MKKELKTEKIDEYKYQKIRLFQSEINSKIDSIKSGTVSRDFARLDNAFGVFVSYLDYLPNPDPVLKKAGIDITEYTNLLSDPFIKGCLLSRKSGVLSKEWEIDRGKAKSRQTKFLTDVFNSLNIYKVLNNMLDAIFYGYQPFEYRWEKTENTIILKDIVAKPQEWFQYSPEGDLLFLSTNNPNGEKVPENKFIVVKNEDSYTNPYGTPLASQIYWTGIFKKGGLKFWVKFTEKYGMPWLLGKYNSLAQNSTEATETFLSDLKEMVQDAIIVAPEMYNVEMTTPQSTSSDIYNSLIKYLKDEISIAVLGHTGSSQSTPGQLGNENEAIEVRNDIIASDKILIENAMNEIIKTIYDLNFGATNDYPKFILFEEEDVDKSLAERDKILYDMGVRPKKEYYIKEYGFDENDFELERIQSPAPLPNQFAEPIPKDQIAIDNEAENFILNKKEVLEYLKPVIDFINKKADFSTALNNLADIYPNLNTDKLERELSNRLFAADVIGRLSVKKETE